MIAKVTASGAGVAGLVEYVYDGREEHRQRGDKKAEVIIHSENLQMPRDANDLVGRRALIKDFDNRVKQRSEKFDYVGMHVLSFTQDEMKNLNREKITDLCQEYVEMANLKKTQYFAIAHNDTDHYHIHFVFNRIDNQGKKLGAHYEKLKTTTRGVAISLNYGLKLKGTSFKIGQSFQVAALRSKNPKVLEIKVNDPARLFDVAKNLKELKTLADKKGIKVVEYWSQQKELKTKNIKIGDLSKTERASFNCTKIGENEYRNEDIKAIFYGNYIKNRPAQQAKKEDFKKLYEQNFDMELLNIKYTNAKGQENYSYWMNLATGHQSKNRVSKIKKVPDFELKIEKIQKQLGIKI
ncbi:MAG: relaxase/mobilization nuclease domain-containing protein [Bacteroidota bacterium]